MAYLNRTQWSAKQIRLSHWPETGFWEITPEKSALGKLNGLIWVNFGTGQLVPNPNRATAVPIGRHGDVTTAISSGSLD